MNLYMTLFFVRCIFAISASGVFIGISRIDKMNNTAYILFKNKTKTKTKI